MLPYAQFFHALYPKQIDYGVEPKQAFTFEQFTMTKKMRISNKTRLSILVLSEPHSTTARSGELLDIAILHR